MLDVDSDRLYSAFCDRTLPKPQWTHAAHLTVCWVALLTRTEAEAVDFLRDAIRSYNVATGCENTATSGYHETITCYYVHTIAALDAARVDDVLVATECARDAPLRYWSRDRLFSREARASWVAPDLATLPAT